MAAPADDCPGAEPVASDTAPESPAPHRHRLRSTIERLEDDLALRADERRSWLVTLALVVLAFLVRGPGISFPGHVVFDETYYAKDAWSLLQYGYEGSWGDGKVVNPQILAGDLSGLSEAGSFIVHPPVGKWLIALGEAALG